MANTNKTATLNAAYEFLKRNAEQVFDVYSCPEGHTQQTFHRMLGMPNEYPGVESEKRVPKDGSSTRRRVHVWYSERKHDLDSGPHYQVCYLQVVMPDNSLRTLTFTGEAQLNPDDGDYRIAGVKLSEPQPLPAGCSFGSFGAG